MIRGIGNDLEAPARALMPELGELSERLGHEPRALAAGLSGSGATMFAITRSLDDAAALAEDIQRERPDWWVAEATLAGA
jgi:4-diphosphocytidyl-2-C-methyl-D-erythritol kinase